MSPDPRSRPWTAGALLLLALLSADLVFVAIHFVHEFHPFLSPAQYSLETDRGYAEVYQYIKTWWITLLFVVLLEHRHEPVYAAWALLFACVLADDAFEVHETLGEALAVAWAYPPMLGLRPRDLGELTVVALAGTVLLGLVIAGYRRSGADAQRASRDLVQLLILLGCFAVLVDAAHVAVRAEPVRLILAVVEDGGEMVTMSLACWYVFGLAGNGGVVILPLRQRIRRGARLRLGAAAIRTAPGTQECVPRPARPSVDSQQFQDMA